MISFNYEDMYEIYKIIYGGKIWEERLKRY
jgi:hypothetical protein